MLLAIVKDVAKILATLLLALVAFVLATYYLSGACEGNYQSLRLAAGPAVCCCEAPCCKGFPLTYSRSQHSVPVPDADPHYVDTLILSLALDIVFWYLIVTSVIIATKRLFQLTFHE